MVIRAFTLLYQLFVPSSSLNRVMKTYCHDNIWNETSVQAMHAGVKIGAEWKICHTSGKARILDKTVERILSLLTKFEYPAHICVLLHLHIRILLPLYMVLKQAGMATSLTQYNYSFKTKTIVWMIFYSQDWYNINAFLILYTTPLLRGHYGLFCCLQH